MDRIDAMKVFVAALDEGSLAGAARKLGRSPAAVSRAIAFLENHVGAQLLHRTTRTIKLSEAGERYAVACRRVLTDLEEADMVVAGERAAPRGTLTITAPVAGGEDMLRPVIDAFIDATPTVSVRLYLLDRPANLIEEGIDVALRFAHLQDSTLVAMRVGEVRRVVVASPRYLAAPAAHHGASRSGAAPDHRHDPLWPGLLELSADRQLGDPAHRYVAPRLVINSVRGAIASAVEGHGVTRLFSYHVAPELRAGTLQVVLKKDEHAPLPVHLITPHGRLAVPKVRAFVDFALPRLKAHFARMEAAPG